MGVTVKGKWIRVSPMATPVAEAAEQSLRLRLETMRRLLPLAAQAAGQDAEHVHQLRVACRRATAAVDAYRTVIPHGKKRLTKWLKRIRRAAGPARDLDVLIERLANQVGNQDPLSGRLIEALQQRRVAAQQSLLDILAATQTGALDRAIDKCLQSAGANQDAEAQTPFSPFAVAKVDSEVDRFLQECDACQLGVEHLHELRISGKHLRYSLELFQSALPKTVRKEVYAQVADLQDRLGRINDHAFSQLFFQRLLGEMPADALAAYVAQLVVEEHRSMALALTEFLDWWTDARRAELSSQLSQESPALPEADPAVQTSPPSRCNGAATSRPSVPETSPAADRSQA